MSSSSQLPALMACMATGITFFLGFIPTARVSGRFFSFHAGVAGVLWLAVSLVGQSMIYMILVGACAFAWHNFRINNPIPAKMFLTLSTGLAIGLGLFRNDIIPFPSTLPPSWSNLYFLSVLFASAVLGSCYLAVMAGGDYVRKSVPREIFEKCLKIFLIALGLRAALLLSVVIMALTDEANPGLKLLWFDYQKLGLALTLRTIFGLVVPAAIGFWGLNQLKLSTTSLKFIPFYVLLFLVFGGEIYAFTLGF